MDRCYELLEELWDYLELRKIKSVWRQKRSTRMPRNRKTSANRDENDYSISYENLRRDRHIGFTGRSKNNIIETVQMCHFKHRRLNFRQPEKEAFLCPHFSHHVFQQL